LKRTVGHAQAGCAGQPEGRGWERARAQAAASPFPHRGDSRADRLPSVWERKTSPSSGTCCDGNLIFLNAVETRFFGRQGRARCAIATTAGRGPHAGTSGRSTGHRPPGKWTDEGCADGVCCPSPSSRPRARRGNGPPLGLAIGRIRDHQRPNRQTRFRHLRAKLRWGWFTAPRFRNRLPARFGFDRSATPPDSAGKGTPSRPLRVLVVDGTKAADAFPVDEREVPGGRGTGRHVVEGDGRGEKRATGACSAFRAAGFDLFSVSHDRRDGPR